MVLSLAIAWVMFVPGADWLARHDVGSAKGPLLQTARDAARGRLLTLGAGLFAAAALVFTALNFNLLRRTSEKTDQWQQRTYKQTEQWQVTDRYTRAIEQLGSSTVDVTIGGIYAQERIAHDSPGSGAAAAYGIVAVRCAGRTPRTACRSGRRCGRPATSSSRREGC